MKNMIKENWYKMMIGTSMLIVSVALLIFAINPIIAADPGPAPTPFANDYRMVPLNEDGSITIRMTEDQLEEIKPPATTDIKLTQIRGRVVGMYDLENRGVLAVKLHE